jgi:large conductance mechanosensitive channel
MLQEFKKFISRGNVVDLAIAVIIGGAFGRIVNSLVDDVLMPVLGVIAGGINLTALKLVIKEAQGETAELAFHYGMFLQARKKSLRHLRRRLRKRYCWKKFVISCVKNNTIESAYTLYS